MKEDNIKACDYVLDRLHSLQMDCYDSEKTINADLHLRDYLSRSIYFAMEHIESMKKYLDEEL